MLSSESMAFINGLRGHDPLLDFVADALEGALNAETAKLVGQLTLLADPDRMNPGTQPPENPKLPSDQPTVLLVENPHGFQKPGDTGPNGGTSAIFRGPTQFVPNREGDIVIDAGHGGIDAGQLYQDGEPVVIIPPPPESGDYVLEVIDGVLTWTEVDTSSCP